MFTSLRLEPVPTADQSRYRLRIDTLRGGDKQYTIEKWKCRAGGWDWVGIKTVFDYDLAKNWLNDYRRAEVVSTEYE